MRKTSATGLAGQSTSRLFNSKSPEAISNKEEPLERQSSSIAIRPKELKNSPESTSRFDRKHMRYKKLFNNHFTPRKLEESSKSSRELTRPQNKELSFLSQVKTKSHFRSSSDEKIEKYFEELSEKMKKIEERAKVARNLKITYSQKLAGKLEKAKALRYEIELKKEKNNLEKTNQLSKSLIESSKRRKQIFQQQSNKMLASFKGLNFVKFKMQQNQDDGEKSKPWELASGRRSLGKGENIQTCIVCKRCNKNVIKSSKNLNSKQTSPEKASNLKSLTEALQQRIQKKIQEIDEDSEITFY